MRLFNLLSVAGLACVLSVMMSAPATADMTDFHPGPAIPEYGRIADVPGAQRLPEDTTFKVVFDISDTSPSGDVNRHIASAARFINMHVAAGVPEDQIHLAIVVHGDASHDLTMPAEGEENASAGLIAALIDHGVEIYLCGQSATANDISVEDLLPGVRMALSAMTEHALLQQQGYTLNPF